VQGYFEALLQHNWDRAYDVLDPDSQSRYSRAQFVDLAKKYGNVGFEPQSVKIRSCDEQQDKAIAHVFLIGASAGKERRYRDGISLRKTANGWRVVLPQDFSRN
jgi:hypothetical protein